jgi:Uma2 family endonuclease
MRPMGTLTLELPAQDKQRAFNLRRWAELLADRQLARIEGRIETDRHGHIIKTPPPAANHGCFQFEIGRRISTLLPNGRVLTECPISTADGVKPADVAWASDERLREFGQQVCFPRAPEICIEVLSPCNTDAEIREKAALYFDAGAEEVWLCGMDGKMTFLPGVRLPPIRSSRLCPKFPAHVNLR